MAKPFFFVIQSWMLEDMKLSLSDAAVYAYKHGLTNSKELENPGWHGSVRRLATVLHTSPSTMNDIIKRLKSKAYIRIVNGFILRNINREIAPRTPVARNPDTNLPPSGDGVPF